ncbi:MAG: hypothetical protein MK214_03795 [Thalassotalea sp.]|nr:hypothetical protein [Thalassotalea sp.]
MRELNLNEIEQVNGGILGALIKGAKAIAKAVTGKNGRRAAGAAEVVNEIPSDTPQKDD